MKAVVKQVGTTVSIALEEIDISADPELERLYGLEIPVLFVAGKKVAKYRVGEQELRRILATKEGTP